MEKLMEILMKIPAIWKWHLGYAIFLFIAIKVLDLRMFKPKDTPEKRRNKSIRMILLMACMYVFPVINIFLLPNRTDIVVRILFQCLTVTLFNYYIFYHMSSKLTTKLPDSPGFIYILLTLAKNILLYDGFWRIALIETQSVLTAIALSILPTLFIGTIDGELMNDEEYAEFMANWEELMRTRESEPERKPRKSKPRKSKPAQPASQTYFAGVHNEEPQRKRMVDSWAEAWEKETSAHNVGIANHKCCQKCRYFDGTFCTNSSSGSCNQVISNPGYESCYFFSR